MTPQALEVPVNEGKRTAGQGEGSQSDGMDFFNLVAMRGRQGEQPRAIRSLFSTKNFKRKYNTRWGRGHPVMTYCESSGYLPVTS